jgi:hypothetical protein
MFTTNAKNTMLDALTFGQCSLHTAFPGQTGASEVSGGAPAYARRAITVGAASGEVRTLTAAVNFDVPATTVRWFGFWNGATFLGCTPNDGNPKEFVAVVSTDRIQCPAHGWANGQKVVFYNGGLPAPLVEGTVYFVINANTDDFQVSATSGGAAIDLTSAGTSTCLVSSITEQVYAAQGTHTLTAATFELRL